MGYRYVDNCDVCGQGLVLIMKDKLSNHLVLICDDCESMWKNPDLFYLGQGRIADDVEMQLTDDVSKEEIIAVGWEKYVKNMDNPIDL